MQIKKAQGLACSANTDCGTGFCVDGVCCESACTDACTACSEGRTGEQDGLCKPITADTDPDQECEATACVTGACDGQGACKLATNETVCRASAGSCDVEETCLDGICPADSKVQEGQVCRESAGVCDVEEACDGVDAECPADAFDSTQVCRASVGDCDLEETCAGNSAECPADAFAPATTECGAYYCEGTTTNCESSCTTHTDCVDGAFCTTGGTCMIARIVFTTSTTTKGNIGGLSGADAMCQARAVAAGLPGTYKAWLSDSNNSAANRLTHSNVPYAFVNGTAIAANWADLVDGTIGSPFRITEFGDQVPGNLPLTSTTETGAANGPEYCSNWTSTTGTVWTGQSDQTGSFWTYAQSNSNNCNVLHRLYCMQQEVSVVD